MNTRRLTALLATLLLLAAAAPLAQAARAGGPSTMVSRAASFDALILPDLTQPHAANRVIVGYQPSLPISSRGTLRTLAGATRSELILGGSRPAEILTLPAGRSVAAAIKDLWGQPGVRYVEPDYHVEALTDPNDPLYSDSGLWGMRSPTSSTASAYGSKADLAWADGVIGSPDVYVGIIDEGVNVAHPDLAENIWTNPFDPVNGRDDDGNGFVDDIHGWDFFNDDNSVYDGGGGDEHGTHVAGTIGALGGNGIGVAGVNWDVTMISTKFLGPGGGSVSDAVDAVKYLTDLKVRHGINIVASSNSWGGGGFSQALEDAVNEGGDRNILFIAAAGNSGTDNDASASYPSNMTCTRTSAGAARGWDCIVAVAAIDANGNLASFSQYGATTVDLGAPGVNILSTLPGASYGAFSGTSMATPHVTGAVALCASQDAGISGQEARQFLLSSTATTASLAGKTTSSGRLDVATMMGSCAPAPVPMTGLPSSLSMGARSRTGITIGWTDGVANESRFEVQRARFTSSACQAYATVGYAGRNATTFSDTGLAAETVYCYRVRATSRYGGGSVTDWTAPVQFTTLPPPSPYTCESVTYSWSIPEGGITLDLNDDSAFSVDLPYNFSLYGVDYAAVIVGSNGLLGFSSASEIGGYANVAIPTSTNPNGFIAPYWDDLYPGSTAQIRVVTTGTPGSRTTSISWIGIRHYNTRTTVGSAITFQAILEEGQGTFRLNYQDTVFESNASGSINNGGSATVGVESEDGAAGTNVSFNQTSKIQSSTSYRCSPPLPPAAPASVTAPSIVGDVRVGSTLSVAPGTFTGNPVPTQSHRWYRCAASGLSEPTEVPVGCTLVKTSSTYKVVADDSGKAIRVGTLASNSLGSTLRLSAAIEVPIVAPASTSSASVSGSPVTGGTLTGSRGNWSGVVDRYDYQWYACTSAARATTLPSTCALIADAASDTFVVTSAQLGKYIRLLVTATNAGGSTLSLSSATTVVTVPPVAPTVRSYPSISGSVRVGRALSGRAGSWNSTVGATYAYQWYRCSTRSGSALGLPPVGCSAISGATSLRYTVLSVDLNSYLRLLVTATNSGGSTSAVSATTSQVSR